jgi:hypothetical protein
MTSTTRHTRHPLLALGLVAVVAAMIMLAGCAGGSGDSDSGADAAYDTPAAAQDDAIAGEAEGSLDDAGRASQGDEAAADSPARPPAETQAIISTGTISLTDEDVAKARLDVMKLVDTYGGQISDEETAVDDEGKTRSSRMVLRIPSNRFEDAMKALEGVAKVESSSRTSKDVTTKVIDNEVRVRAQEKSLARIEALLAQAETLPEIISIESQLSRRQADLDSLKSQQSYLKDQTSLSTINVYLEQTEKKQKKEKKDDSGFLAGLDAGWSGLVKTATAAATVAGAVLPFAVVLAVLGVPIALLVRRSLRRRPEQAPASASAEV